MSKLLVIDDDPAVLVVLRRAFADSDTSVLCVSTGREGLEAAVQHLPDVVLLDIQLPDISGLDLYQEIRKADATIPVIFITASGTSETVIEAMKHGAFDYLQKPLDLRIVRGLLQRAFEVRRLMHTPVAVGEAPAAGADVLIGRSSAMREVYKAIGRTAGQNVTVLIRGESGTGKELVARALYQHSPRSGCPFLAINCAAIPEALLESELFGHERGAFTGADRQRIGKFEQCHGGTLFLDEIGDMPPLLQAKMLRLLQEQQFERVGGNQSVHTDVRILAATHQNLEHLIAQGRFRADLYYRLKVVSIEIPPLRQRMDDLPILIEHLLVRFRRELEHAVESVSEDVLEVFRQLSWPGNVRELESVLKQAALQASSPVLVVDDLPTALREVAKSTASSATVPSELDVACLIRERLDTGSQDLHAETLTYVERHLFREVLQHTKGNQAQAAKILGIARNSLRKKIEQFGIRFDLEVNSDESL